MFVCLFFFWKKDGEGGAAPDVDGRVVEDLAVAVPAAVGGGAAAGRVVAADVGEDLALAAVAQVQQLQVRVALVVARREAEAAHAVHLHEGQVELAEESERSQRAAAVDRRRPLLGHTGTHTLCRPVRVLCDGRYWLYSSSGCVHIYMAKITTDVFDQC